MKIVADRDIPFLRGVLEPWAEVRYLAGEAIGPADVREADALIVRTRTRCDARLLAGSRVQLVVTATIGFDHIDTAWCDAHGIRWRTAVGCNARGVLQWVAAALVWLAQREGWHPAERTLGVVGVGHVGSLVAEYAAAWGFRVLGCDPPREARERCGFLPLEEVAAASDILTFHTPLDDTTRHLIDGRLLRLLPPKAVVINASRGEVADTAALLAGEHPCILDVWENEPHPDPALLERALLATPHIAGYSRQGKANATAMAVAAVAEQFGLPLGGWYPAEVTPSRPRPIGWEELCRTIGGSCDLAAETARFKAGPSAFESLRNKYIYREEYF